MYSTNELLIFVGVFPVSLLITYLVRELAKKLGIVNKPNIIIPQHTHIISYMGGVAISINILFIYFTCYWLTDLEEILLLSEYWFIISVLFLILGLYDDIKCLSPTKKFIAQLLLSITYVYYYFDNVNLTFSLLSIFWIVMLVNAYNFLDVMDGLAGGVITIFFATMIFIDSSHSQVHLIILLSILAFMVFNSPPASIFMGDAGSHFLGFLVAIFTLNLFHEGTTEAIISGFLLVAIPLFELTFITLVRMRKGLPWWRGSPDHMALRLQHSGLSRWKTNFIIWSLSASMCLLAYLSYSSFTIIPILVYWLVPLLFIALTCFLLMWEVEN